MSRREIRLGAGISLPVEAVTETFAFLAMRGAGKSNAVVVMAEEMHRLGLPWVAVDPKGDWWGIRSDATGSPGLPVPIFGGLHGDVPLEPEAGAFIAELIVRENLTCVLDVSEFTAKAKQARFLADFADRLYRLHGRNPQPRHVFAEEADEYIPQRVYAEMAKCVGAWEQIIKRGRQRGLGCSIVSQRSASVNKDALSQVLTLVAMRTTGTNDRKAILGWVDYHAAAREIVDDLPMLTNGDAWLVSPQWLGRTERITIDRRSTFDSGATPTMGKDRPVATLADIDLGKLREELAATIDRAAADDPKTLRARIAQLERELAAKTTTIRVPVEIPVAPAGLAEALEHLVDDLIAPFIAAGTVIGDAAIATLKLLPNGDMGVNLPADAYPKVRAPRVTRVVPTTFATSPPSTNGSTPLGKAERSILSVLAQFPDGRSKKQLAMLSGYSIGGGAYGNALGALRSKELISPARVEPILITDAGVGAIAGHFEPLPRGAELLEHWQRQLGKAERLILGALVDVWPATLTKDELAGRAGYEPTGGGFGNALGRLRTLELISPAGVPDIGVDDTLAAEVRS